jgi:hypothetical protein
MSVINVLIFPAGEINSIELHDALSTCVNIRVYGASSIERHGSYVFENYISGLPLISDDNFISVFNEVLKKHKIDVIFPTHDTVAMFLMEHNENLAARVVGSSKETAEICRDKQKIYDLFNDTTFVPSVYSSISKYPVFIKPREGQGAKGALPIFGDSDIPQSIKLDDYVICEYLPGEEYTVDCLTDKNGGLVVASPRSRLRTMAGICIEGKNECLTQEIKEIAEEINKRLFLRGLWWFQIKRDKNGKWKLLEISVRCSGTMCLTRALGINIPLMSVYVAMGYEVKQPNVMYNVHMDRAFIARYKTDLVYDVAYVDFDDTITIRGELNLKMMWFLYQCKNKNIRVILITKHANELYTTLSQYHIDPSIFDEIIHIPMDALKSSYIKYEKAIFIDNAYKEREEVNQVHHIPVFDVDTIDVLLDWKI